jgi:PBP1b-binding outer membrane lipoprotein LpoB
MKFLPRLLPVAAVLFVVGCSSSQAPATSEAPSGTAPQADAQAPAQPQAQAQPAEQPKDAAPFNMSYEPIRRAKAAAEIANKKNGQIEKEAGQGN